MVLRNYVETADGATFADSVVDDIIVNGYSTQERAFLIGFPANGQSSARTLGLDTLFKDHDTRTLTVARGNVHFNSMVLRRAGDTFAFGSFAWRGLTAVGKPPAPALLLDIDANLHTTRDFSVGGAMNTPNDLTCRGALDGLNVDCTGDLALGRNAAFGNLVTGSTTMEKRAWLGRLEVEGDARLRRGMRTGGDVTAQGASTLRKELIALANMAVRDDVYGAALYTDRIAANPSQGGLPRVVQGSAHVKGDAFVGGDCRASRDWTVDGNVTTAGLVVGDRATLRGPQECSGEWRVAGTGAFDGSVTVPSWISRGELTRVDTDVLVGRGGLTQVGGFAEVAGDLTVGNANSLRVDGLMTFRGDTASVAATQGLRIDNAALGTWRGDTDISGGARIRGETTRVQGDGAIHDAVVRGDVLVGRAAAFGYAVVERELRVGRDAVIGPTLVHGDLSVGRSITFGGDTTVTAGARVGAGFLDVRSSSTLANARVQGRFTVSGAASVVGGPFDVFRGAELRGTLAIDDAAWVRGDLRLSHNARVLGRVLLKGPRHQVGGRVLADGAMHISGDVALPPWGNAADTGRSTARLVEGDLRVRGGLTADADDIAYLRGDASLHAVGNIAADVAAYKLETVELLSGGAAIDEGVRCNVMTVAGNVATSGQSYAKLLTARGEVTARTLDTPVAWVGGLDANVWGVTGNLSTGDVWASDLTVRRDGVVRGAVTAADLITDVSTTSRADVTAGNLTVSGCANLSASVVRVMADLTCGDVTKFARSFGTAGRVRANADVFVVSVATLQNELNVMLQAIVQSANLARLDVDGDTTFGENATVSGPAAAVLQTASVGADAVVFGDVDVTGEFFAGDENDHAVVSLHASNAVVGNRVVVKRGNLEAPDVTAGALAVVGAANVWGAIRHTGNNFGCADVATAAAQCSGAVVQVANVWALQVEGDAIADLGVFGAADLGALEARRDVYVLGTGPSTVGAGRLQGNLAVAADMAVYGNATAIDSFEAGNVAVHRDVEVGDGMRVEGTTRAPYVTVVDALVSDRSALLNGDLYGSTVDVTRRDLLVQSNLAAQSAHVANDAAFDDLRVDGTLHVANASSTGASQSRMVAQRASVDDMHARGSAVSRGGDANRVAVRGLANVWGASVAVRGNLEVRDCAVGMTVGQFATSDAVLDCNVGLAANLEVQNAQVRGDVSVGGNVTVAGVANFAEVRALGPVDAQRLQVPAAPTVMTRNLLVGTDCMVDRNASVLGDTFVRYLVASRSANVVGVLAGERTTLVEERARVSDVLTLSAPTAQVRTAVLDAPLSNATFGTFIPATCRVDNTLRIKRGGTKLDRITDSNAVEVTGDVAIEMLSNVTDQAVVAGGMNATSGLDARTDTLVVEDTLYVTDNTCTNTGNLVHVAQNWGGATWKVGGDASLYALKVQQPCLLRANASVATDTTSKISAVFQADLRAHVNAEFLGSAVVGQKGATVRGSLTCVDMETGVSRGSAEMRAASVIVPGDFATNALDVAADATAGTLVEKGVATCNLLTVYASSVVNANVSVQRDAGFAKNVRVAGDWTAASWHDAASATVGDAKVGNLGTWGRAVVDGSTVLGGTTIADRARFETGIAVYKGATLQNGSLVMMGGGIRMQDCAASATRVTCGSARCGGDMRVRDIDVVLSAKFSTVAMGNLRVTDEMTVGGAVNTRDGIVDADLNAGSTVRVRGRAQLGDAAVGVGQDPAIMVTGSADAQAINMFGDLTADSLEITGANLTCRNVNAPSMVAAPTVNITGLGGVSDAVVLNVDTVKASSLNVLTTLQSRGAARCQSGTSSSIDVRATIAANAWAPNTISVSKVASRNAPMTVAVAPGRSVVAAAYATFDSSSKTATIAGKPVYLNRIGGMAQGCDVLQWMKEFDANLNVTRDVTDRIVGIYKGAKACGFDGTMGAVNGMDLMLRIVDIFNLGTSYTANDNGVTINSGTNAARAQTAINNGANHLVMKGSTFRITNWNGSWMSTVRAAGSTAASLPNDDLIMCKLLTPLFMSMNTVGCYEATDVTALYGCGTLKVYLFKVQGTIGRLVNFGTDGQQYGMKASGYTGYLTYAEVVNGNHYLYAASDTTLSVGTGLVVVYKLDTYTIDEREPMSWGYTRACYDMDSVNTLLMYYTYALKDARQCSIDNGCGAGSGSGRNVTFAVADIAVTSYGTLVIAQLSNTTMGVSMPPGNGDSRGSYTINHTANTTEYILLASIATSNALSFVSVNARTGKLWTYGFNNVARSYTDVVYNTYAAVFCEPLTFNHPGRFFTNMLGNTYAATQTMCFQVTTIASVAPSQTRGSIKIDHNIGNGDYVVLATVRGGSGFLFVQVVGSSPTSFTLAFCNAAFNYTVPLGTPIDVVVSCASAAPVTFSANDANIDLNNVNTVRNMAGGRFMANNVLAPDARLSFVVNHDMGGSNYLVIPIVEEGEALVFSSVSKLTSTSFNVDITNAAQNYWIINPTYICFVMFMW